MGSQGSVALWAPLPASSLDLRPDVGKGFVNAVGLYLG